MSDDLTLAPSLVAYVGEDEFGSGVVGLKAALVPAGRIALVATRAHQHKLTRTDVREQLQYQANAYGKTIRLVRYEPVEVLLEIVPR